MTLSPVKSRGVVVGAAVGLVLAIGACAWLVAGVLRGLPDVDALRRIGEMDQATAVFDRHDALAFTIYREQRIDVPLAQIAPSLTAAILAIEDQRFYRHHGFDALRMGAAMLANLRSGRLAQGGSTITQQLARQSFLTPNKTIRRKLQELVLARRIERLYDKDQILEMYLNKVYFGDGLYGVEAASRGYLGKHASELSVEESALLAGLVKSPSSYAPTVSMARAVARRNVVLRAMRDTGAIDVETWQRARSSTPALKDGLRADEPYGQYFKEQIRRELVERFGWQRVYQGGLRVFSTIDVPMQIAADRAVASGLASIDARRAVQAKARRGVASSGAAPLQAAVIAMDPASGHVRAMTGGRSFADSHFNRALQAKRQPGSAFKPFVYAAALEAGFTPATLIENLNAPVPTRQGDWTPDDEHLTSDRMTLRDGLRTSSNRAAVRLLQEVGITKTVAYAKAMGVGDVPGVPSLALGSGEVTLQSLTAAYAAFANDGIVPNPVLIRRVEDRDGSLLYEAREQGTRAISGVTAYLMADMLADVIDAGTAARARTLGFTLPAGGKTGTTNDFHDAWFVGFTPSLVAGVWVGFDKPQPILPGGFASEVAVPLWASFMLTATRGAPAEWLSPPNGVVAAEVCALSGKRAADGCSQVYTEHFASGTEPTAECDVHQSRGLMDAIAAVFTGSDHEPAASRIETAPPASTAAQSAAAGAPDDGAQVVDSQPKKKRGFWSRVFGIGRDEDNAAREARKGRQR